MGIDNEIKMIPVNDTELSTIITGSGVPLILLHGFPQTNYMWRKVIPYLKDKFLIIAPDLRGVGDSKIIRKGFDKKMMASDIKALMDFLNIPKAIIAGADWGAVIGQRFIFDYPESAVDIGSLKRSQKFSLKLF